MAPRGQECLSQAEACQTPLQPACHEHKAISAMSWCRVKLNQGCVLSAPEQQ
jgi:hypothetical protein